MIVIVKDCHTLLIQTRRDAMPNCLKTCSFLASPPVTCSRSVNHSLRVYEVLRNEAIPVHVHMTAPLRANLLRAACFKSAAFTNA